MATIMAVRNETNSSLSRVTKAGRRLTYELIIIQQPERARACGSGAKSSADRRPVDPPPVVQLRILEGEAKKDITFSYNANFFLFTTLEHARPMAQGRVPPSAQTLIPVLTGTPVAGMAYLDRPDLAGYFVFPDLSVRHEGKYRLSFNLYEEVKDPKDADAEPTGKTLESMDHRQAPRATQPQVHFRLEVKSIPFNVYSAKKFPGLAESTTISRIVAEQGCRVRIRRDVRMRRRDVKPGKSGNGWEDDQAYSQAFQQPARPQSSNSPYPSFQQPPPPAPQSQSANAGYPFQPHPPPAPKPQSETSGYYSYQQPAHLAQRSEGTNNHTFQQPSLFAPRLESASSSYTSFQQSSMAVPRSDSAIPSYSPSHQISPPAPRPESANSSYGPFQQPPQQAQQPQSATSHLSFGGSRTSQYQNPLFQPPAAPASQLTQNSIPKDDVFNYSATLHPRRMSNPKNGEYSQAHASQSSPQNGAYGQAQPPQSTSQKNGGYHHAQASQMPNPPNIVYRSIPGMIQAYDGPATKYSYATLSQSNNSGATSATKRTFGAVFSSDHLTQPMHSGQRPTSDGQGASQIEAEDGTLWDEYDVEAVKQLTYKRADGSRTVKKCPLVN